MTILNVSGNPNLPLDPAEIQTMSDYDLALCFYRTWFEYDQSRQAIPGIVSKWIFDNKIGAYHFTISNNANWSDGSTIEAQHLIKNLERMIKNKSSYGASIDAIIDFNSIKLLDNKNFVIPIKNKLPSPAFFQRMGSIFLAIVHPIDLDKTGDVIRNSLTNGPYKIKEQTPTGLILNLNQYDKISNSKRIPSVHIKFSSTVVNIEDFLEKKTFENIIQTTTLMPIEIFNKVLMSKFPYWTRSYDRVSYISPVKSFSKNSEKIRNYIKLLGQLLRESSDSLILPKNVKLATSLQPEGYPLYDKIFYELKKDKIKEIPRAISILAIAGHQLDFQKKLLQSLTNKIDPNIKINWTIKATVALFLKELENNPSYDLKVSSFGVADPEAVTWLSLVLNKKDPFVEVSENELEHFEKIVKKQSTNEMEIVDLKKLLTSIGERGGYLPLFHFSTMSIAQPGIGFENINELDETVDYSKLVIE